MSRLFRLGWVVIAGAIAVVSAGCQRAKPCNVLLVTFDTTRADHIGCYGNQTIKTPTVDGLAAEGVRFASAYSAAPITCPSHTTILTGKYPMGHGVRDNGLFVLSDEQETLAEIFKRQGYATAAAISGFPLLAKYNLKQGFDLYDDKLERPYDELFADRLQPRKQLFGERRPAARTNEAIYPWLGEHHAQPFFVWIHYYDPHQPLEPPPPYNQLYADDPYDGEIAYADECLGAVLKRLRDWGVYDRTLVVFAADHGEGLGEHDELTHAFLAYDSTLHVPLVIRPPQGPRGLVVEERVSLADVAPTILGLAGLPRSAAMQGRSLKPLLDGKQEEPAPPIYAESLSPHLSHGLGELRALYQGRWKYIHGPRPELFDLTADPKELHNLVEAEPERVAELRDRLSAFIKERSAPGASTAAPVDEQTRQQLMALGYLQGNEGESTTIVEELRDGGVAPQDRVADISAWSQARALLNQGQALAAREVILQLVKKAPTDGLYLEMLATAELQLGRLEAAQKCLDEMPAASGQSKARLLLQVAGLHYAQGRPEEALTRVRESLALDPSARGYAFLARLLSDQGRVEEETTALEKALELAPDYSPARVQLAVTLAERGDSQRAQQELERVLADDPYSPFAHFNYGTFLLSCNRLEDALYHFQRAVELRPGYTEALHALIVLYASAGDLEAAKQQLAALEAAAPGSKELEDARRLVEEPR